LLEPKKGTHGRESMNSRRMFTSIFTVLALLSPAAMPATAAASSLLSGYGGPGQGNQAILGSALLNGPSGRGGGGAGSAGSGGGSAAGSANLEASGGPVGTGGSRGGAARHASRSARRGKPAKGAAGAASKPDVGATPMPIGLARSASGGSGTLGLSGADVMYIILALAILAITGAATRQLMRGQDAGTDTGAKGMRRRIRGTE
jgi:hypothetical protein